MDIKKSKILLKKINSLFENMNAEHYDLSNIEKDLMLSYIRQFYETFFFEENSTKENILNIPKQKIISKPQVEESESPSKIGHLDFELRGEISDTKEEMVENQQKTEIPDISPGIPSEKKEDVPIPQLSENMDLSTLFEIRQATELSEKLSVMPVNDLRKAMGINERLLTINELFNGDFASFDETINKLNSMSAFTEAKDYLSEIVVPKFRWTDEKRKNEAKKFIKFISRRYS